MVYESKPNENEGEVVDKKEEMKKVPLLTKEEEDNLYNDKRDDYQHDWQRIHN